MGSSPSRVKPDYKIGTCCFSAKHAALRRKSKDWLVRNQNNVSEWNDMSDLRWFSPGTPVSATNKTDCHDITEILLKVALNTINQLTIIKNLLLKFEENQSRQTGVSTQNINDRL